MEQTNSKSLSAMVVFATGRVQMFCDGGFEQSQETIARFVFPEASTFPLSNTKNRSCAVSQNYVFTMTDRSSRRLFGYCRREYPASFERQEPGSCLPEVLCVISYIEDHALFKAILDVFQIRRRLDSASLGPFFDAVRQMSLPSVGESFRCRSATLGIMCEYKFFRSSQLDSGCVTALLAQLSPKILHFAMGALYCERRLIFVANNLETLSACVHGARMLLYPFKWQHMFVPLLPSHLLEYVGAPSPFIIGVLRSQLAEITQFPIGDVVFVDLDVVSNGEIRIAVGGDPTLHPFGFATSSKQDAIGDQDRAVLAFMRSVSQIHAKARQQSNAGITRQIGQDLLDAWLSFSLFVFASTSRFVSTGSASGGPQLHRERFVASFSEAGLRNFVQVFINSQMFAVFLDQVVPSSGLANPFNRSGKREHALAGGNGDNVRYSSLLTQVRPGMEFSDVLAVVKSPSPKAEHSNDEMHKVALEMTSNTPSKRQKFGVFSAIARRTYDSSQCSMLYEVICTRLSDSSGRNWKHGHKALLLILFLLSAGSEIAVASALRLLPAIYQLTKFSSGAFGVSNAAILRMRLKARSAFVVLTETNSLRFQRTARGHLLLRGASSARSKKESALTKRIGRDQGRFDHIHEQVGAFCTMTVAARLHFRAELCAIRPILLKLALIRTPSHCTKSPTPRTGTPLTLAKTRQDVPPMLKASHLSQAANVGHVGTAPASSSDGGALLDFLGGAAPSCTKTAVKPSSNASDGGALLDFLGGASPSCDSTAVLPAQRAVAESNNNPFDLLS